MKDAVVTIKQLKQKLAKFVKDRDWEQYHSPKNLSMSIAIEAAELMEMFQWLTIEESRGAIADRKRRQVIEEELADIAIYILDFCNLFKIDLSRAIVAKLQKNAKKYPVRLAKGNAHKYTYYERRKK